MRSLKAAAATLGLAAVIVVGAAGTGALSLGAAPTPLPEPVAETLPTPSPEATPAPSPTSSPTPTPSPTPLPTPVLVPAPLTGRMVTERDATQHPIAVMVDDAPAARPQSGFTAASIVWHAPAEGGVPRYMLVFQEQLPEDVGPVRSARYYFITWAAEYQAVFGHVGGSPQAQATLRAKGNGQLVYDADQFRWGHTYYRRIRERPAPHNVYSDAKSLRIMATKVGAENGPLEPAWQFAPDAPLAERPSGGIIRVDYPYNKITYRYDRATNTYLRSVTGEPEQIDAATGERVAPSNVVVMLLSFGPLNDGSNKHRLEADVVGGGKAWIATNGRTIEGTWEKRSLTDPTRFYDADGEPVVLTAGQTFIQVMPLGSKVTIKDGSLPNPAGTLGTTPSASPSSSAPPG